MPDASTIPIIPPSKFAWPARRKAKARRPGPITAVDLDGTVVRVAQSAPRGQGTAITRIEVGSLDLDGGSDRPDPEIYGKALADALEDLRIKPAQVVMAVPRPLVVLRGLNVPAIDDERELASIVHMQIARDLPFRIDDAVIDFVVRDGAQARPAELVGGEPTPEANPGSPLAGSSVRRVEILVAVVRRETVEFYQRVAAAARVKLVALGWLSQANARWLDACQLTPPQQAVALLSLRPEEIGIDIVVGKSLLFSRGAPLKKGQTTERAEEQGNVEATPAGEARDSAAELKEFIEAATIEVVRTLHSYGGSEQPAPVSAVIVTGVTGHETHLLEALSDRLKLPCRMLDLPPELEMPASGRAHAPGAIGALGLALGVNDPEGLAIDFLTPRQPAVQRNTKQIRRLAWIAAAAVLLVTIMGVRTHLIRERRQVGANLQKELAEAQKKLPVYRRMQLQASGLQNWSKDVRDWLEHYAYLSAVLPRSEDLYITSLSVSSQGNIHLAVQARSGEILANLDRQLRAAGYEVKPLAITPGSDRHGYSFRSTVELIVPPKLKIDLSKVQPPARPEDDGSLDPKLKPTRGGRS